MLFSIFTFSDKDIQDYLFMPDKEMYIRHSSDNKKMNVLVISHTYTCEI